MWATSRPNSVEIANFVQNKRTMTLLKAWMISLRLRTLPLALSTICMGSIVAAWQGVFRTEILVWAALTTLFLQILSNLANDYGDAVSGADGVDRLGPQRMIQSRSEEHTSELQSRPHLVCRLLLE